MLVLFTVKDRIKLLPYFFRYYMKIGATRFLCCLASGTSNPLYPEIEAWKGKVDLEIRASYDDKPDIWCGPAEQAAVNIIRQTLTDKWHVMADLDEFYWLPPGMGLYEMLWMLEKGGYMASTCHLIDRIAADGSLAEPGPSLDATYPVACEITRHIGGCINKVALVRTEIPLRSGHHTVEADVPTLAWGEYHHFKWLPGVLDLIVARSRNFERMGLAWYAEGDKTAALFQDGKLMPGVVKAWPAPFLGV